MCLAIQSCSNKKIRIFNLAKVRRPTYEQSESFKQRGRKYIYKKNGYHKTEEYKYLLKNSTDSFNRRLDQVEKKERDFQQQTRSSRLKRSSELEDRKVEFIQSERGK